MKTLINAALAAVSALALTACGGSGDGTVFVGQGQSGGFTPDNPDFGKFYRPMGSFGSGLVSEAQIQSYSNNVAWQFEKSQLTGNSTLTLGRPSVTSATYEGVVAVGVASSGNINPNNFRAETYSARFQMNADFAGNSVNGLLDDLSKNVVTPSSYTVAPVSGNPTFSGTISGFNLNATVAGNLDGGALDGMMIGSFSTADTGEDIVNGLAILDRTTGAGSEELTGAFIGSR